MAAKSSPVLEKRRQSGYEKCDQKQQTILVLGQDIPVLPLLIYFEIEESSPLEARKMFFGTPTLALWLFRFATPTDTNAGQSRNMPDSPTNHPVSIPRPESARSRNQCGTRRKKETEREEYKWFIA